MIELIASLSINFNTPKIQTILTKPSQFIAMGYTRKISKSYVKLGLGAAGVAGGSSAMRRFRR